MNDQNIYILYKKIFNNKYLNRLIYDYVHILNFNQIYNYLKNVYQFENQLIDAVNNRLYSYNSISFDLIFKNNFIEIFKDRIKTNTKSNSTISSELLSKFLCNKSNNSIITKEEFELFYNLNNNMILEYNENSSSSSSKRKKDLFEILVENNKFEFLKIIYYKERNLIEKEKEYYYKENKLYSNTNSNNNNHVFIFGNKELKIQLQHLSFFIYTNFQLIKTAFENSTLEIIKFLNSEIKLDFEFFNKDLLYWSIKNFKYRNELVNWLLDEFNYKVPLVYNGIYSNYYNYLFKLNYKTFKRVVIKEGSPMLIHSITDHNELFSNFIDENKNHNLPINQQIESILKSLTSLFKCTQSIEYMVYLKLIKQLIKYDKKRLNNLKITSNSIKLLIEKIYNKYNNNNNIKNEPITNVNSNFNLFNYISSYFITNTSTTSTNDDDNDYIEIPKTLIELKNGNYEIDFSSKFSTNIDYKNFNLEREIKRIYIFEFLNTKNLFTNEIVIDAIVYFIVKFDFYKPLDHFLNDPYFDKIMSIKIIEKKK